jgi:dethiobiotin synthetase
VFVAGTDTGVGKTLLTALLLAHLRSRGAAAVAVKPFATGGPADARLLGQLQPGTLGLAQINPFFFPEPVAPLVAARRCGRRVSLARVQAWLAGLPVAGGPLLVEGAGGLLTPLGPGYTLRELIRATDGRTVIVAPNRLGVLNQVLLVCEALRAAGRAASAVVLMGRPRPDASTSTNGPVLASWIVPVPVLELPHLGPRANRPRAVLRLARTHAPLLSQLARALGIGQKPEPVSRTSTADGSIPRPRPRSDNRR